MAQTQTTTSFFDAAIQETETATQSMTTPGEGFNIFGITHAFNYAIATKLQDGQVWGTRD